MAPLLRLDSQSSPRVVAGLLSAAFHFGLIFIALFSGGRHDGVHDGDTPLTQLVLIEAPKADRREGVEAPHLIPTVPTIDATAVSLSALELPPHDGEQVVHGVETQQQEPETIPAIEPVATDQGHTSATPLPEVTAAIESIPVEAIDAPSTFALSAESQAALLQQVTRTAETLATAARAQATWQADTRQYSAVLILERAKDGSALDRVVAEVSAEDRGKQVITRIKLKRLAFSNYAQMVDRWDPTVQLHDDEIDGRLHINSRFNLMYDRRTAPKLLGKVTTAARSFNTEAFGGRRERDIFRGGIETRAGRIALPEQVQPFAWAPRDENARVHECANDTRIRFFADGSYTWRALDEQTSEYRTASSQQPVYFVAGRGATVYVKGVVAGSVLIYSPDRIIVEGNLTYAHDPRDSPDSRDYLGLVSDRYVQIAPPHVTGRGDLTIHAAIFARRGFVVKDIDSPRSGTLRIYGSVTAGTLSATEPRYATKLEYDTRFEERRPPGFPATNRYVVETWDGRWTAQQPADGATLEFPSVREARAEE